MLGQILVSKRTGPQGKILSYSNNFWFLPPRSSSFSSSSATSCPSSSFPSVASPGLHLLNTPLELQNYVKLLISCSKQCVQNHAHHLFDETPHRTYAFRNGRTLHARILRLGFLLPGLLGNALVDLYSKSADLGYAQKAFDCLEDQDGAAFSSILLGWSMWGSPQEVIGAFRSNRCLNNHPDQYGFAIVLSACTRLVALNYGQQVHCDVIKVGFGSNSFSEASLIDMYSKCNQVSDARRAFDCITSPDTISWTNMIAAYVRIAMFSEALELFSRMEESGAKPDQVTYVTGITACVSLGRLKDARALFEQMPSPNIVAWNAVISGLARNDFEAALGFYKEMRSRGVMPNRSTLGSVFSAAANLTALDEGRQIHSEAVRLGLDLNIFVGSSLINLYAKCSHVRDARKIFEIAKERNIVMWNAVLGGLIHNEQPEEVLDMFLEMRRHEMEADEFTFVSVLGACAFLENVNLGRQLHSVITKHNFEMSTFVANSLLDMYVKSGELNDAKSQLELIPSRGAISWNTFIVGLVHNEDDVEALSLFKRMIAEDIAPDEVSIASILSACTNIHATEAGRQIHCLSIKYNLSSNHFVGSSLIDLYAKHRDMDAAKKAFSQVAERGVVPRNALIAGHIQNNTELEAFDLLRQMQADELVPSNITFLSILPACTGPSRTIMGKQVHCHTLKSGFLHNDIFLEVSLLGMYLKSKMFEDSHKLFSEMPENKSLVLWTAMISGLAQNSNSDEAMLLFWRMRSYSIFPDEATFASVLRACSDLTALTDGKEAHGLIVKAGFASHETARSALIDMYSKCGEVSSSYKVFNELEEKEETMPWNSMIVGFAKNGHSNEAVSLFQKMQQLQIKPDDITFLGVLTACVHAGLVSEGQHFLATMIEKYGITPRVDHYASVIDLLGRFGHLQEAQELIDKLPFQPDSVIWATFLAACKMHSDEVRGELAARKLIELESGNATTYVSLSNFYATLGNWCEAKMMRGAMRERGVKKIPGCSWITVVNRTSIFLAADKFHPNAVGIYEMLDNLNGSMKRDSDDECELALPNEEVA